MQVLDIHVYLSLCEGSIQLTSDKWSCLSLSTSAYIKSPVQDPQNLFSFGTHRCNVGGSRKDENISLRCRPFSISGCRGVIGNLFLDSIYSYICCVDNQVIVEDPLFSCHNVPLKCSEILLPRNCVKEEIIFIKNSLANSSG